MSLFSRRAEMKDVRAKIMEAMERGGDIPNATILALLLGILDEIREEVSLIRGDLPGLREAVLNGHVDVHHEHHEWISKHMKHNCDDVCDWARGKMNAEKEDESSRRKIRDGWIGNVLWAVTTLAATLMIAGFAVWVTGAKLVVGVN